MSGAVEVLVSTLTALTLLLGLCGLGARYVLLPWLREHLVTPVKETNHQVTVNRHVSPEPTMLDKLDTVASEVGELRGDVTAAARMFEGHITSSEDELGRLWAAVRDLQRKGKSR